MTISLASALPPLIVPLTTTFVPPSVRVVVKSLPLRTIETLTPRPPGSASPPPAPGSAPGRFGTRTPGARPREAGQAGPGQAGQRAEALHRLVHALAGVFHLPAQLLLHGGVEAGRQAPQEVVDVGKRRRRLPRGLLLRRVLLRRFLLRL